MEKNSVFLDWRFVKTCDELVIGPYLFGFHDGHCEAPKIHASQIKDYYWGKDEFGTKIEEIDKDSIQGWVSVQEVESLWGDCRFIPADWGS